jgi:hypothetical protein
MIYLDGRNYQIAEMIGRGLSNRGIAEVLGLAEGTIKVYATRIYPRLGIGPHKSPRCALALLFAAGEIVKGKRPVGIPAQTMTKRTEEVLAGGRLKPTRFSGRSFKKVRRKEPARDFSFRESDKRRVQQLLGDHADPNYYNAGLASRMRSPLASL